MDYPYILYYLCGYLSAQISTSHINICFWDSIFRYLTSFVIKEKNDEMCKNSNKIIKGL